MMVDFLYPPEVIIGGDRLLVQVNDLDAGTLDQEDFVRVSLHRPERGAPLIGTVLTVRRNELAVIEAIEQLTVDAVKILHRESARRARLLI